MRGLIVFAYVMAAAAAANWGSRDDQGNKFRSVDSSSKTFEAESNPPVSPGYNLIDGGEDKPDPFENIPQTVEYHKQVFYYSAPEEEFKEEAIIKQLTDALKNKAKVIVIKIPEDSAPENVSAATDATATPTTKAAAVHAVMQFAMKAMKQKAKVFIMNEEREPAESVEQLQRILKNEPVESVEQLQRILKKEPIETVEQLQQIFKNESVEPLEKQQQDPDNEPAVWNEPFESQVQQQQALQSEPVEAVDQQEQTLQNERADWVEQPQQLPENEPVNTVEEPQQIPENEPADWVEQQQPFFMNVAAEPEVRIIKYRTQDNQINVQASIQAHYDHSGGPSPLFLGGFFPVLDCASGREPVSKDIYIIERGVT